MNYHNFRILKFIKKPRNSAHYKYRGIVFDDSIISEVCMSFNSYQNSWGTIKCEVVMKDGKNLSIPLDNFEICEDNVLFADLNEDWKKLYKEYVFNNFYPNIGTIKAISYRNSRAFGLNSEAIPKSFLINFTNFKEEQWIGTQLLPLYEDLSKYEKGKTYTFMLPEWIYKKYNRK